MYCSFIPCHAGCAAPLYFAHTPQDLLDRYLEHSAALHSAEVQAKQSNSQMSPDTLLAEVRLLRSALLLERHRREVYARRNSKLLARVVHLVSAAEKNDAMVRTT